MIRILLLLLFIFSGFYSFAQNKHNIDQKFSLAKMYHESHDREEVIDVLNKLIENLNKKNTDKDILISELSGVYDQLGLYHQTYGQWVDAAQSYNNGLELLVDTKENFTIKSKLNLHLGLLYVKLDDPNSKYYLDLSEEQALKCGEYEVLSILYKVTNRLEEGIKFTKINKDHQYLSNFYYLKANTYLSVHLDTSKLYFDSARVVMPPLPESLLQNFQYNAFIVDYFLKQNELDSALFYCEKAKVIAPLLNDDEVDNHVSVCFAATFLAIGDTSKYFKYNTQSKILIKKYKNSNTRYELSEMNNERINKTSSDRIIIMEKREVASIVVLFSLILILLIIGFSIRQIYKVNNKLKETNENMDRLFSIISHDLRGSIAAIKILSKSEKNHHNIERGTDALLLEFDSLLLWSAKHLDNILIHQKVIDVNELVDEVISLSTLQSSVKKINIDLRLEKEFIAFADINMIKIVFRNVLNNAIKYSKHESTININAIEKNGFLYLTIVDNGLGFNHYYSNKGIGLGLELCKDFLELNGGELIIESSFNGSNVIIKLLIEQRVN